ncbi:hypothetical protein WDL1CHR_00268 [Variovorax sp. WDL1]|nr:hypothetical protein CHC07_05189 [Variovorax sp. B4]PNG55350.1 hypothetical protein CHC06_04152 [Variovorax sp. B2]VTV09098.1 hypothetical protein WDL1CHR_00268 [Variovorax sp. WDL1]
MQCCGSLVTENTVKPSQLPRSFFLCAGLAAPFAAPAQPAPDALQQRYEREIAACNNGTLAAPAREACIRAAGTALDRARGGPPAEVPQPSADGRATIVAPPGAAPSSGSDAVTSGDGRATIVRPAGQGAPQR